MSEDGYGKIESEDMSRLYDVYISKNVLEIMMQFKAVYFSTIPVMDVFCAFQLSVMRRCVFPLLKG